MPRKTCKMRAPGRSRRCSTPPCESKSRFRRPRPCAHATPFRSTVSREITTCASRSLPRPARRQKSPQHIFRRPEIQRHRHIALLPVRQRAHVPVFRCAVPARSTPSVRRQSPTRPDARRADKLKLFLPRVRFRIVRNHLKFALKDHVQRQFVRPRPQVHRLKRSRHKIFQVGVVEGARCVIHRAGQHAGERQSRVVRRRHPGSAFKELPLPITPSRVIRFSSRAPQTIRFERAMIGRSSSDVRPPSPPPADTSPPSTGRRDS